MRERIMNIVVNDQNSISVVTLNGSIAHEDIAAIRNRLADLVDNKKVNIVLDLQNVSYLSSKFLAAIIDAQNSAHKQKGDLKLARANNLIKDLFNMTLLINKIEIYNTLEEASRAFG
jgi:anti-sigma B factor antagonist